MTLKMIRFLSRWRARQTVLRHQLARLQKAYNALDKYCSYLISRVHRLEDENDELRKEVQWKTPSAKD